MNYPSPLELRVGVDVGCHNHVVAIGLSTGQVLEEFSIRHEPEGFRHFFSVIEKHERIHGCPVAVAMGQGDVVDFVDLFTLRWLCDAIGRGAKGLMSFGLSGQACKVAISDALTICSFVGLAQMSFRASQKRPLAYAKGLLISAPVSLQSQPPSRTTAVVGHIDGCFAYRVS